jgi:DNA-binding MarR family transcriptional regulator
MAQADRFAELLSGVAREVTRRQASEVCCGDLTLAQFQTLRSVSRPAASSIGSLSAELHVDVSTMSRNVALLEKNGYLARARSEDDGRVVQVTLTAKGHRALHTLHCGERDVLGDVYERLPATERPRVIKALETLSECLEGSDPRVRSQTPLSDGAACCPPRAARKAAT